MTSLEDRLQRIEAEVDRLTPSLNERLDRLEAAARASGPTMSPSPPRSLLGRFVSWAGSELPKFLFAGLLLLIGWGIKDSVDLAIKQRQLDLSYAKELQSLLQKMGERDADKAQLTSTAIVMASFGEGALPALMSELRYTGLRSDAAVSGLELLTLTHPEALCDPLPRLLVNRARQFDWQAHQQVVRLLGVNGCTKAVPQLKQYRILVNQAVGGKDSELAEFLRARPLAPAEEYPLLLETVDQALLLLANPSASAVKMSR